MADPAFLPLRAQRFDGGVKQHRRAERFDQHVDNAQRLCLLDHFLASVGADHHQRGRGQQIQRANLTRRLHAVHHRHAPVEVHDVERLALCVGAANRVDGGAARINIDHLKRHGFEHAAHHAARMAVVVHYQGATTAQVGTRQQNAPGLLADSHAHCEPEVAARAKDAANAHLATHEFRQLFRDRQAQAGAAKLARGRAVGLREALE